MPPGALWAISRALVALADSGGGALLLGVGDRGDSWGLWYVALTGASVRTANNDLATLVQKGLVEPAGGRGAHSAYRLVGAAG